MAILNIFAILNIYGIPEFAVNYLICSREGIIFEWWYIVWANRPREIVVGRQPLEGNSGVTSLEREPLEKSIRFI